MSIYIFLLFFQIANTQIFDDANFIQTINFIRDSNKQESLAYLENLENHMPDIGDLILFKRAEIMRSMNRPSELKIIWHKLLYLYPNSPWVKDALVGLGDIYFSEDDFNHAMIYYKKYLDIFSKKNSIFPEKSSFAIYNIGKIYEKNKQMDQAIRQYKLLISYHNAMYKPARERLALLHVKIDKEKLVETIEDIDKLIKNNHLAQAQEILIDLERNAQTLKEHQRIDYRFAQISIHQQEYIQAIDILQNLIDNSQEPEKTIYMHELSQAQMLNKQLQNALTTYRDVYSHNLKTKYRHQAHLQTALLAYNNNDYLLAKNLFSDYIQHYSKEKNLDEAMWYLAWCSYQVHDFKAAHDTLIHLREKYPKSRLISKAYYWQGRTLMRMNKPAEAAVAYNQSINTSTGYYATISKQRLKELARFKKKPSIATHMGNINIGALPWGIDTFDWNNTAGGRIKKLIALGQYQEAAQMVHHLSARASSLIADVHYQRARLLYSLDDFASAYSIISIHFANQIRDIRQEHTHALFKLAYPLAYQNIVENAAYEFNISPFLILSVMRQESGFQTEAASHTKAQGLMQIEPTTGKRIAKILQSEGYYDAMLLQPDCNVRFAAWYLSQLLEKFQNNVTLAVASYNAGPKAIERWINSRAECATDEFIENIPYKETRQYVKNVLANLAVYQELYQHESIEIPTTVLGTYRENISF